MDHLDRLLGALLVERPDSGQVYIPQGRNEKRKLLRALLNVRPPGSLPAELLTIQDAELKAQIREKGIVEIDSIPHSPLYPHLALWQGDITRLRADTIVNAANSKMLGCFVPLHNCIDNAIHSLAGLQLRAECAHIMAVQGHDEPVGGAKITAAYNLPANYIIHTVGPIIAGATPTTEERRQLAQCYRQCMRVAAAHNVQTLAFCCISTGVFRFPQQEAAEIAVSAVLEQLEKTPLGTVVFDVFTDRDTAIYRRLLGYN